RVALLRAVDGDPERLSTLLENHAAVVGHRASHLSLSFTWPLFATGSPGSARVNGGPLAIEISGMPDILWSILGFSGSFMRLLAVLLLTTLFAAVVHVDAAPAAAAKLALVIGNAKYPDNDIPMNDSANDAQDV